jgi:Na+/proline symporter
VDAATRATILVAALGIVGLSFAIGWWAKRRATTTQAFFGATAMFGPFTTALSSMAAVASAFALVGVPGLIYASGNTISLWMLGSPAFALGYLMLGKRVRAMAEVGPVASLGDLSDLRFGGHRGIKALLSAVLLLGCLSYLASQVQAGADLFGHLLGVRPVVAGLVIFGVLTLYTVISGEVGGILTQAFQGMVMVAAGAVVIVAFFARTGGPGAVLEAVAHAGTVTASGVSKSFSVGLLDAWGTLPGAVALAWVVIPVLGVVGQPQVITRMYALKDPRDLPRLSLYVTIAHMVVALMVVLLGFGVLHLVATGRVPPLASADRAIFVFADALGPLAQVLIYAAVLAAAMSTSSLFLSLAGGIVSRDLPSAFGVSVPAGRQMPLFRATVLLLGLGSIAFALSSGEMVAILGAFGYGTLMSATLPVFVLGLLWKRASSQGVLAGLAVALGYNLVSLILDRRGFVYPGGLPWYVNVVAASLVVTIVVSLFSRDCAGERLDRRVAAVLDL